MAGCSSDAEPAAVVTTDAAVRQPTMATAADAGTDSSTVVNGSVGASPVDTSVLDTVAGPPSRAEGALDASTLADRLDAVVTAALSTASTPADIEAAGVDIQLLLRYLANHSDLDADVLALLDAPTRLMIEPIVSARQFGQARAAADPTPSEPSPTLPAWTIIEPLPVAQLRAWYDEAEAATGVPWYWLGAIHLQETRMGRIVGVSSAGAVGPMQFLPSTWADCCDGDPTVARDAIVGAATYLAQSGAPADMRAAVHQYNPNDSYVATVTAYASALREQPQLLDAFHAWQVFAGSAAGTVRLPVGYSAAEPVDAAAYLADHPADAA